MSIPPVRSRDQEILVSEIYVDAAFNTRLSAITYTSVAPLIRSIEKTGLLAPIVVEEIPFGDPLQQQGYLFRLLAGFRRYHAFHFKGWTKIAARVTIGLTSLERDMINITENVERKELSIVEEAKAFFRLNQAHLLSNQQIADRINRSKGYVDFRVKLLGLPPEIIQDLEDGVLNHAHIRDVLRYKTPEEQFERVRQIRNKLSRVAKPETEPTRKPTNRPVRKEISELNALLDYYADYVGFGLHTRTLAWAAGHISTDDLMTSVKEHVEAQNKRFIAPKDSF
jgi:ParB/RepB/Spo0J family partition protein